MGRQTYAVVGGIIGAVVVGYFTAGTGTAAGYEAGFAIGAAIGGLVGSYVDPVVIQGNKIGDNNIQVAAEGGARAIIFGRACVTATCIIARGNRQIVKHKDSNGKGASPKTENETVTWTFAIGLGEALVGSSISRIWQDGNLVYDVLGDGAISTEDNAKFADKFKFYDGAETQLPDPDLQVFLGDDTPYFRGTAYVVFPDFDLTQTAERVPQFKFEILQGVSGIIDELETLAWSLPNSSVHTSEQSVTLAADPGLLLNIDMFLTGSMEVRLYNDPSIVVVGGLDASGTPARFITADTPNAAAGWTIANIYKITISDPPQTYYMNQAIVGESPSARIVPNPDGSANFKLSVKVRGNATVTFSATDVEGASAFYPQYGNVRCDITGGSAANTTIALSSIVDQLLLRSGMTADQFDTSALTDQIAGVCIQETATGADAVGAIVGAYFADPTEKDGKLIWVKRGGNALRTLVIDDLVEEPDVSSRQNVIEYPMKMTFFYQSPATGYAMTKATSNRYSPEADSSGEGSVTSPVTFYTSDEPAQIAQKLHKVAWTEAEGSFTWKVGSHCLDLLPADVVGLYLRGVGYRVRITAIENDGNTLTLTMMKDRQSNYTSQVTTIPLPAPTPPLPTTMSTAVLGILDIPALQDTDDSLVYYSAMSGSTRIWRGGQLQRSLDGGVSWQAIGDVTTDTTMGRLTVAMTAASAQYTDSTNTITVQLFDSANVLISQSETTFNQGQGAVAVQLADGTWEVLQYRDALDGGNGLYTLSILKRGRLSTVPGAHAVGALFVLLDTTLAGNAAQTAWLGADVRHRAVSYTTSAEDAAVVDITYEGRSQIEWSPASATAQYDTKWVYVFDIVPRHRFGTEVSPIASTNFTGYQVVCSDGTNSVTAQLVTTAAHIDCSSIGTVTSVTISATNRITGPGAALVLTPQTVATGSLTPEAIVNAGGGA